MIDDNGTAKVTELEDGGAAVEFTDGSGAGGLDTASKVSPPGGLDHFANLADKIDAQVLSRIGLEELRKIEDEKRTREPWMQLMTAALGLMGLTKIDVKEKGFEDDLPEGAQTTSSLMLTSIHKSLANAAREMGYVDGPIAVQHIDLPPQMQEPPDKADVVERVERFFNRYLKVKLPAWFADMDRTLLNTIRMGCSFKKVYADPEGPAPVVIEQIDPQNLIVQADARSLYSGVPITHQIPKKQKRELTRLMEQGHYRQVSLTGSSISAPDQITAKQQEIAGAAISVQDDEDKMGLYERHCWLTLDDDRHPKGLARPYILTLTEDGGHVLRLERNWMPGDPSEAAYQCIVMYMFQPGDSAVYAIGLGQMLYAVCLALKAGVNAALAAAWLSNHQGGFKSSEFDISDKSGKVKRGEFVDVNSSMGDITKMIMPFPFKGPEPALIQLLEKLDGDGRELAGVLTMNVAEATNANTPPGTVLAALDEASVIPASSHVRIYLAFEQELRLLLHNARRVWGQGGYQLEPGYWLAPGDLDRVVLVPRMRPGAFSRQRRIAEAQTMIDMAGRFPQLHDTRAVMKRFYAACGTEDIDEIVPPEPETKPADPVTEAKNALAGKPLKAGLTQDHQAHIRAHTASVQLFASRADLGDAGVAAAAAMQAHIGDHLANDLAVRVASVLGLPLQLFAQEMPPEVEMQIAPAVAQAIELVSKALQGQGMTPEDLALQIENIRAASREKIELMKANTAITTTAMKVGQEKETQKAETARAVADDLMALRIHVTPSGDGLIRADAAAKAAEKADAKAETPNPGARANAESRPPSAKAG